MLQRRRSYRYFILEVHAYGEGEPDDKIKNIRGAVFKIYDGAGKITIPEYDFKGNPLNTTRTYALDKTQHPDWTIIDDLNLEITTYVTAVVYDALNRPKQQTTPDNAITSYSYDKGGLLKTVAVDNVHSLDTDIVNTIAYDAKGQRTKIQYENGTTTTYEYDAFTFKVRRIRTTRHSDSKELQDLRYWYDPVGNITLQKDLAQQTVYFEGTVAEPHNNYTYDALYRLIQAEGREHAGNNTAPNHNDSSRVNITPVPIASADTAKMRKYIQYYKYDAVGNFIEMRHTVTGGTGNWTRTYNTASSSNRMLSAIVSSVTETYSYDNRGNIIGGMNHLNAGAASMVYNAENRLEKVIIDANQTAYYQYDNNGQRVRKTIINSSANKTKVRKYIGEWEVFSEFNSSSLAIDIERETLHISDDTGRIALIDTPTENNTGSSETQLLRYQYSNHLGSATLELDHVGAVISYEEYYPYGSTSFQSGRSAAEVSLKRYRYTGKERDEESGLYYHGARYYVPWLCRWTAVDPINSESYNLFKGYGLEKNKERQFLELTASSYEYSYDNPIRFNDLNGEQVPPSQTKPLIESDNTRAPIKMLTLEQLNRAAIPERSSTAGIIVEALGGEPAKYIVHYRPKDGSDNITKVETIYSLTKMPSKNIWSTPTVRPKMVQFIKEDRHGNEISHTGNIPLKNFGSTLFAGPWNPKYQDGTDRYDYPAINSLDATAKKHDKAYDLIKAIGATSAIADLKTIDADKQLVKDAFSVMVMYKSNAIDPVNKQKISEETYIAAIKIVGIFSTIVAQKTARIEAAKVTEPFKKVLRQAERGFTNMTISK